MLCCTASKSMPQKASSPLFCVARVSRLDVHACTSALDTCQSTVHCVSHCQSHKGMLCISHTLHYTSSVHACLNLGKGCGPRVYLIIILVMSIKFKNGIKVPQMNQITGMITVYTQLNCLSQVSLPPYNHIHLWFELMQPPSLAHLTSDLSKEDAQVSGACIGSGQPLHLPHRAYEGRENVRGDGGEGGGGAGLQGLQVGCKALQVADTIAGIVEGIRDPRRQGG